MTESEQVSLRRDFQNVLLTYNLRGMDLEVHLHQSPGRKIPTIAWTAGGKVSLLFERKDVPNTSPLYMSRRTSREFVVFLMFHELGHNFWPPEHIVPIYTAGRLWSREGRNTRINVPSVVSELVDIIVNTHILRWDISKFFPEFTPRGLFKSNLKWDLDHLPRDEAFDVDNIREIKNRWNSMHRFLKWNLYYYHYPNLPVPHQPSAEIINKILAKRPTEPVTSWRDDFYESWLNLIEQYGGTR
jgi:hypothetical protein